jgi:anti-sigma28 factor (negative regulator of flagellin synthesis)
MNRADDQFERNEWLTSHLPKNFKIMVVEFNTGGANYIPLRQTKAPSASASAAASADSSVSLESTQALEQSLKQSSQVRPEKVAAATALVSDGSYPSDATLNRLAGFLASRLNP